VGKKSYTEFKVKTIMNFVKKHLLVIVLTVAGALAGFAYWKFIGCLSGSCPIKSRWYLMILYGALVGYLVGSLSVDLKLWLRKRRELKSKIDNNGIEKN